MKNKLYKELSKHLGYLKDLKKSYLDCVESTEISIKILEDSLRDYKNNQAPGKQ